MNFVADSTVQSPKCIIVSSAKVTLETSALLCQKCTQDTNRAFFMSFVQGCGWASSRICGLYPHAEKPFLNSGVILTSVGALRTLLEENYGEAEARGEFFEHDQA